MFEAMRKVFGPITVSFIIGLIALVFIFSGVFSSKSMPGGARVAAEVNGESILLADFERQYRSRSEYFGKLFNGQIDPRMETALRNQVLQEMVGQKLLMQQAEKLDFGVADAEVRDQIMELPYFKKKDASGAEKFDPVLYRELLAQNGRTPSDFEELIRKDLLASKPMGFFRGAVQVSEQEVKDQFMIEEDRRTVDYVLLDRESVRKHMTVSEKEIKDFLSTAENVSKAKQQYEMQKMQYVKNAPKAKDAKAEKPKAPEYYSFEEVKSKVVTNYLKDRRIDEMNKMNEAMAKDLHEKAKAMNAASFRAYAKAKGFDVKTSEKFNRVQPSPGLNGFPKLLTDAFQDKSALSQEPQLYQSGVQYAVAFNLKKLQPKDDDFEKQRGAVTEKLTQTKSQNIFQEWMSGLREKAKVKINKGMDQES